MSEATETEPRVAPVAAAADIANVLLVQMFALDGVFRRALKDARSLRDISRALKAQALPRDLQNPAGFAGGGRRREKNREIERRNY